MDLKYKIQRCLISHSEWPDQEIADIYGVSKGKVYRIRKILNSPSLKIAEKKQGSAISLEGFEGMGIVTRNEKGKVIETKLDQKGKGFTAIGPLMGSQKLLSYSLLGQEPQYDEDTVNTWHPHMALSVYGEKEGRPLTASEISTHTQLSVLKKTRRFVPTYYVNPMQELDYMTFEAISRSTFGGPLMMAITKFIIGTGFRPELELINPNTDSDKNQKLIDENQDVISNLMQIDNQLNYNESSEIDVSFTDKLAGMVLNSISYNRGALMYEHDQVIKINNKSYKEIPSSIISAHPRDLGITKFNPETGRIQAVQWRMAYDMRGSDDMLYLWNPMTSARTRNSWGYGDSLMTPMIDPLRVVRKNIGVNFQAMAETSYAGLGFLVKKPYGTTTSQKQKEWGEIATNATPAAINFLLADPKDVMFHNVNFDAKVKEFSDLNEALLRYCVACQGLPQTMFYDESASNRATMIGKIQLATATTIQPMREWISRMISAQWYQRWFRLLYKSGDKHDILKKFRVRLVFDDLDVEQWFDLVEAANKMESRKELTDKAYGDKIKLKNYSNMVVSGAPTNPGGDSGSKTFGADSNGEGGFEIKDRASKTAIK